MAQLLKFHLFNCDNIYQLSIVEDLLKTTKAKLGFEFSVEKHIFALSEMSELSTKTIPAMKMDFAMFVVHAHESVLLINDDDLEHGYAKVYRALLQATGENVIVVIGGDDNYKNETEEEQSVISRWAKRKIAYSQFSEEFMDGRKSFVFSWNKKHRAIHVEALLHYFNPRKKGQKFEYQLPQAPLLQTLQSASSTEVEKKAVEGDPTEQLSSLVSRIEIDKRKSNTAGATPKKFSTSSSSRDKRQNSNSEGRRPRPKPRPGQRVRLEESPPSTTDRTKLRVEKVIILICDNCSLPPKDEEIISRTIEDMISRGGKGHIVWLKKGKLSAEPDVLVKCLTSTSPTPQRNPQTNSCRASQEKKRDAPGSVAELFSTNSGQSQSGLLQRNPSDWGHMQPAPTTIQPLMDTYPAILATGEPVWLRSILRYGIISFEPRDLQLWDPAFVVPESIIIDLIQRYQHIPEIGVRIVQTPVGQLQWSVDPKLIEVSKTRYKVIEITAKETLVLKTRIFEGLVSFQENDVDFKYGSFRIPQEIVNKLKEEHYITPCGELYIISGEKGNLRTIVKIGTLNRFLTLVRNTEGF